LIAIVAKPQILGKTVGYLLILYDLLKKIVIGENEIDVDKSASV